MNQGVDYWFRIFKDWPLERHFMGLIAVTNCAKTYEMLGIRLINYRLDEISDIVLRCAFFEPKSYTEKTTDKILRKLVENCVNCIDWRRILWSISGDTTDMRRTTMILIEMGQDTEFKTEELSYFLREVVRKKTGYIFGRGYVEQLFMINMIIEAF